jgi:hypothetical protein
MGARASLWTTLTTGVLLLFVGCKTSQPDLKPPPEPEVLNRPPDEARFNSPAYPKQALVNNNDPTKKWNSGAAGTMNPRGMGGGGSGVGAGPGGGYGR